MLAPEAAARRKRSAKDTAVRLASCHRVLRGQLFTAPGAFQRFRLFALVTSARDRGSGTTEAAMLTAHLRFWSRALGELLPALEPLPERVTIEEDPARERARGYYERGAIRIDVAGDAGWHEVGDGGFTDWTARLLSDAKERCFVSCAATERLAALRPDG